MFGAYKLGALLVLVNLCSSSVWAQLGIDTQNASGEQCECSPSCEGDVGVGGVACRGRVVAREDCPCCKVCAQQEGSPCSNPALPCDTAYGLVCSPEGICEAEYTCQIDKECPEDRFCLGNVCVDPCPILVPCQGALKGGVCVSRAHRPICECPEGMIANSDGNVCVPINGSENGCQHDSRLYGEGEVRYNGQCEEQCRCMADGKFNCGPVKCPVGLFLAGQHSKDELCIELRNRPETDECCVVVACANSLTRPSLLSSPADNPLAPIAGNKDSASSGQAIQALSGRSVPLDRIPPISEEEYQKRLKDLEIELNKGTSNMSSSINTESSQHDMMKNQDVSVVTSNLDEASLAAVTEMDDAAGVTEETIESATVMPEVQQAEEEMIKDNEKPAVIMEINDHGEEVQMITVTEKVVVVTNPAEEISEIDSTTTAELVEDVTTMSPDMEISTEPTPAEEERENDREGKKAPEEQTLDNESTIPNLEKAGPLEKIQSSGGLKIMDFTHNSTTLLLPSTKGGDIYYKPTNGTDWQRMSVEVGQASVVLKGLKPMTSYTLKWSGTSAKMSVKTLEGCQVQNISYGVAEEWTEGCQNRCFCRPGGTTDCQARCLFLSGSISSPRCTERPAIEDPECCVAYDCEKTETQGVLKEEREPGQPKLLITEETHTSVTLAWDDFRAKTYEGGYVVEYREEAEVNSAGPEDPWQRKELPTGHLSNLTVDNLKPDTIYEVRVSIYDETDDSRLGESTETLTVRTKPGCMHNGTAHVVGEFFNGCEERCVCFVSGDIKCFERCTLPYFRSGAFKDDPLCREQSEEGDECCVTVQCATGDFRNESDNLTSFTNITDDNCAHTVCGANAVCVTHSMNVDFLQLNDSNPLIFGHCQCLDGFVSNSSDPNNCVPDPTWNIKAGVCTYKSNTYQPGQVFYDECEYRCSCNNNTEIECEPRCTFPHKLGSNVEPGCVYKPDPEDSCCQLRVCNSTSEAATDAARAPSLISDGCTEGNMTYAKNEKFYKGCETQCICMGFGDVSCVPRCPPMKVISETPKHCQTLPDPTDDCCSITVCDEETPDVMKTSVTEMEKEMEMMKEKMKNMTELEENELSMKRLSELEKEMMMKNMSDMEMILSDMIEKKNAILNSENITQEEKEMVKKNMTGIETMMRDISEMERQITTTNMTDDEKDILKMKLMDMRMKLDEEVEIHRHTHDDGTVHSHPGGHLPHSHEDMEDIKNMTHTHEDGLVHSHPGGEMPHTHNEMVNNTHVHEDGTIHTHEEGHIPHEHDSMNTLHSHSHTNDNSSHDHSDIDELHEHALEKEMNTHNHSHDMEDHTHEDGTNHAHPHDHMDESHNHTHTDHDHSHTHDDGTSHSHPHDHMDESHNHTHDMEDDHNHIHTHEDGTTHSHAHEHMNESHNHEHMDDNKNLTHHMHDDGSVHLHHDTWENDTHHMHENGAVHMHHNMTDMESNTHHMHDDISDLENETHHMHDDGTVHMHHDMTKPENETHHMHEDGTVHMHHDMTKLENETHHMHEDGTVHMHHDMTKLENETHHMHEDGAVHMHHDMTKLENETHHMHEDGAVHMHHDMTKLENETHHLHEDGAVHMHHNMTELENETHHMHNDGTVHKHHDMETLNQTMVRALEKKNRAEDLGTFDLNILDVMPLNSTSVKMRVAVSKSVLSQILSDEDQLLKTFYSPNSIAWMEQNISVSDIQVENMDEIVFYINELQPSTPYQFRISYRDHVSSTAKAQLLDSDFETTIDIDPTVMCSHEGRYYKPGQEFYEGCSRSCICSSTLEVHCAEIECPVTFGLELIDPNCLEWDLDKDYIPTPPKCCAQVKCVESAACHYEGQVFNNYDTIPRELTGCSQVCTCNYGNVTCLDLCDRVPSTPPPELNCDPQDAVLVKIPGETCCESWQCAANSFAGSTVMFPMPPDSVFNGTPTSGFIPSSHDVSTHFGADNLIPRPHITSMDPYSAKIMFSTPNHLQGLPGELIVRYTKDPVLEPEPSSWMRDVIVPDGTTINHSKWEYVLNNLEPASQYTMQLMLTIMGTDPVTSPVFTYNTMPEASTPPTTTPLARLDIDAELYASEITKTSAKISWRMFNEQELRYIDGVQVKYFVKDQLIPKVSQLFHRDNNQMDLRGLQPGTYYTVDLVFITHKHQTTQVSNIKPITFETLPEEDPYAFEITITAGKVAAQTAELFYSGVPEPEEKYVNVYRAVYLKEIERIDAQTFKIPKTGQEKKIHLGDLTPQVDYQVWLEAYLSNGRKKKSNVITISTPEALVLPKPEGSKLDSAASNTQQADSYYPALVAVAIIAAIACVGFIGLLVMLLRKQSHAKAHINTSRNNAAYDNPSYKVGDNGYDMEMNGIKGSGNGATHAEEP